MRAQFDTEPTLGMNSIEDLFVDPKSRDDTSQIILALQSIWMATDLRDRIVMYLQEAIGENTDQNTGVDVLAHLCLGRLQVWPELRF